MHMAMNVYDPDTRKITMMSSGGGGPSAGGGFASMLGPISSGLNIASDVFAGIGMLDQSKQYASSARALEKQAKQALEQSFVTAIDIEHQGQEILGTQTAVLGKSGSALEGSPLAVLADTANQIDENAERAIAQGRIQYAALMRQARKMKRASKGAKLAGIMKIATSPLQLIGG